MYNCTHPDVFAKPYVKEGDFYNNVKKSILLAYPVPKGFTSESIADERETAQRRLPAASTAHAVYERQDAA
jgi:hypothetical protein